MAPPADLRQTGVGTAAEGMESRQRLKVLLVALLLAVSFRVFVAVQRASSPEAIADNSYQRHKLAQKLMDEGRYDEAEQICLEVLKSNPAFFRCGIDLGNIHHYRGDYLKAEKVYLAALEHVGNNLHNRAVLYYDLGGIYERERVPDKSWDYFRRAYALKEHLFGGMTFWSEDPTFVTYYVARNDRAGFETWIRKEKGLLPEEVYQRSQRLQKNIEEKQYLEALGDCTRYLQGNPGSLYSPLFQQYKALSLASLEEWGLSQEVLEELRRAPLQEETSAWVLHLLGYVLIAQDRPAEGIRCLYEITQKYPTYSRLDEVRALAIMAYGQKYERIAETLLKTLSKSASPPEQKSR